MSKTIPIWTCVLNRSILNHRNRTSSTCVGVHEEIKSTSVDWDCSLHMPLWVSETERASIEERLNEWTKQLDESGADIASLVQELKKPLRPLWISQKTVIWLNEVPDHDSWDFTPIILVSASSLSGIHNRSNNEFSWNYIPGAGDDEESWARGLSPSLFWRHVCDIINSGPGSCNQKVAEIVERDRVYRAQRGQNAPQVTIKPSKASGGLNYQGGSTILSSDYTNLKLDMKTADEENSISWLGSTNLGVGKSKIDGFSTNIDGIINCDEDSASFLFSTGKCLDLPMVNSKCDRFSIAKNLPSAVSFAESYLSKGKTVVVCCHKGDDISVCVSLAILMSLFDEKGNFDGGQSFSKMHVTKSDMRRRLVFICSFAVNARPSRGNLKQIFAFLSGARIQQ